MDDSVDIVDSILGKRIITMMLLAGIIPLIVFTVPLYWQSYGVLKNEAELTLKGNVKLATGQLFQTLKQGEYRLAELIATRRDVPAPGELSYFSKITRVTDSDELNEFPFADEWNIEENIRLIRTDPDYKSVLTPAYSTGDRVSVAFVTLAPDGSFWVAEIEPTILWQTLRPSFYGEGDVVVVLDETDRILSSSREKYFDRFDSLTNYFPDVIPAGRMGDGTNNLNGLGDVVWVSKQLWLEGAFNSGHWRVVIFRPKGVLQSLPVTLVKSLGVWLFIALAGLILLSFRFARQLFEPVDQLSRATNELATGNWDAKLSVNTGDELEILSENFKTMRNKIQETNEKLKYDATHDLLTGLPNRDLLDECLGELINTAQEQAEFSFGVVIFDLDRFKVINDSLGHKAGDEVLKSVADRLRNKLGNVNLISRMGGDEFVVLLDSVSDVEEVEAVADQLEIMLSRPFDIRDQEIYIDVSMGIAFYDDRYSEPEQILRDADTAMYRAKKEDSPDSSYVIFGDLMRSEAQTRLDMETDIQTAVREQEFELYFQPVVNLHDLSIAGGEVLIRWNHPEKGMISPGDFIPVAEEIGSIKEIGKWVLTQSFNYLEGWRGDFGEKAGWLSVNLSPKQLFDKGLEDEIDGIVEDGGHDPSNIKFEITENALMSSRDHAVNLLETLRNRGFQVAMDDFGTGQSSLALLQDLPLDVLKIDRQFIEDVHVREDRQAIVAAVNGMANQMNLDVIVEGIETQDEFDYLRGLDCKMAQGFYCAYPMPPDEYVELFSLSKMELKDRLTGDGKTPSPNH